MSRATALLHGAHFKPSGLTEEDLVALLMEPATEADPGAILARAGGLRPLLESTPEALLGYGLTENSAGRVIAVAELARRYPDLQAAPRLNDPRTAGIYLQHRARGLALPRLGFLALDGRGILLRETIHASGETNILRTQARDLVKAAQLAGATAVVIWKTRPAGEASPTEREKAFSVRLKAESKAAGLPLLDFIIVVPSSFYSFSAAEKWPHL